MRVLSIIVPCFNSEENISELFNALAYLETQLDNYSLQIVCVDDGSTDDTFQVLCKHKAESTLNTKIVKLTKNYGSYNAFMAGLHYADGTVFAQVHPDMQDHPNHLLEMIPYYEKGFKLVIANRVAREDKNIGQSFAGLYHWFMKKYAINNAPKGGFDLILFDKEIRDKLITMNERNINIIYLISWFSYPYVSIPITRTTRTKGKSQWTFKKKLKLSIDSVVGFTYFPIQIISIAAFLSWIFSLIFVVYICTIDQLSFSSKMIVVFLFILINMLFASIAILGEYLWRTLDIVRNRPTFVVETIET